MYILKHDEWKINNVISPKGDILIGITSLYHITLLYATTSFNRRQIKVTMK